MSDKDQKDNERRLDAPLDFLVRCVHVRRMPQEPIRQGPTRIRPDEYAIVDHTQKRQTYHKDVEMTSPTPKKCTKTNDRMVWKVLTTP